MHGTQSLAAIETLSIPDGAGPAYRRLADELSRLIGEGRVPPGTALPPERFVAERLGVARVTVRGAYRSLSSAGLLETRQGSGTFVRAQPPRIQQSLRRLSSFSTDMTARGRRPGARLLAVSRTPASEGEARALGLAEGAEVVRLERLRLADDMPMAIEAAAVPAALLGGTMPGTGSLYALLESLGLRPVRATQRITAVCLDAESAALLDVAPGGAALLMERTSHDAAGRAVEHTRSLYRGDAYDFLAELEDGDAGR